MKVRSFYPIVLICVIASNAMAQRTYPKEIRGYKVERAAVELKSNETKKPAKSDNAANPNKDGGTKTSSDGSSSGQSSPATSTTAANVDQLITFGSPSIARV